jgi:gliding motility-associated-like protein
MAGTYNVIVYQTPDCPSLKASVTIAVNPKPDPKLTPGYVCVDGQDPSIVLSTYTLATGLSDVTYDFAWYTIIGGTPTLIAGETQSSYVVSAPGNYGVVATNVSVTPSCPSTMVVTTVETSSAPKTIEIIASNYFADVQTITINATPAGNYEYALDNGAFQSSNVFSNVGSGEHEVTVRDIHQCGELPGSTYIVDFPRYFTPNGDGYHDEWNISALSGQTNAKIHIFDRFGKLLKEIRPSSNGWNGTFNQQFLPSTDYWFIVHYEEKNQTKEFKSHFALKR